MEIIHLCVNNTKVLIEAVLNVIYLVLSQTNFVKKVISSQFKHM